MDSRWLIAQAIALETAGAYALLSDWPMAARLVAFLVPHGIACAMLTFVLWRLLPERYRQPLWHVLGFLFSLQLAVPWVGSIGLAAGLLLALYLPRDRRRQPWLEVDVPELPFRPLEIASQPLYSEGGLRQVLREASDPAKRLKAVMATKQMNERDGVRILQQALKDPVDDVRLLAYAMLDGKEKRLSAQIGEYRASLEQARGSQRLTLLKQLAQNYWEMAYLGLAQGGVQQHFLRSAREAVEQVLSEREDGAMLRLHGRILLVQKDYAGALAAFERALAAGVPRSQVLPYLAEIAFYQRRFEAVQELLLEYSGNERVHPSFRDVITYWI